MKMENNIFGLRGKLGNVVFKKYSYGTVITAYPDMSRAGCSVEQRQQRLQFKQAVSWAKNELSNPELKSYYKSLPGKDRHLIKQLPYGLNKRSAICNSKDWSRKGSNNSVQASTKYLY